MQTRLVRARTASRSLLVLENTLPLFGRQNLEVRFEGGGQGVEMLRRDGGNRRRHANGADLLQEGIEGRILPAGLGNHRLCIAVVANPADCGLRARGPAQPDVRRDPRQRPCGDLGGAVFLCNIENFHAIGPGGHSPISYRSRLLSCALESGGETLPAHRARAMSLTRRPVSARSPAMPSRTHFADRSPGLPAASPVPTRPARTSPRSDRRCRANSPSWSRRPGQPCRGVTSMRGAAASGVTPPAQIAARSAMPASCVGDALAAMRGSARPGHGAGLPGSSVQPAGTGSTPRPLPSATVDQVTPSTGGNGAGVNAWP